MMDPEFQPLLRHEESKERSLESVSACANASGPGVFRLAFKATGDITGLALPPQGRSGRGDQLWRHTCFEMFVRRRGNAAYTEVNISPSADWAVYRLDNYRAGQRNDETASVTQIESDRDDSAYSLAASLNIPMFAGIALGELEVGFSAVIEDRTGAKSFWALAHPPGAPDFHHRRCFAGTIAENATQ